MNTHVAEAASRLFRAYRQHCTQPNPDALFNTLNAMHSLNDRLKKVIEDDFHKYDQFVALKALRNLTHHAEEVRANVRLVPMPGISDLALLCIVRRDQVERAIENVDKKWRQPTKTACASVFHWYGPAVNINPCLFNFMVHAYEMLERAGMTPTDDSVKEFSQSYRFEADGGRSHFVDGRISAGVGQVQLLLSAIAEQLPAP